MTHQEWENASEDERNAEYERCKDPVYFYNTYWVNGDGTKPEPITHEYWEQLIAVANNYQYITKRRHSQRHVKIEDLPNKIQWRTPTPQAYDGSELNFHHEDPADWRGVNMNNKTKKHEH